MTETLRRRASSARRARLSRLATRSANSRIEGESEFEAKHRYPGINITATGSNVITLGDGNVLNVQYQTLHNELNSLKQAVAAADSLSEDEKLNVAVDIESIKDQLAKTQPNKSIIRTLWQSIERAVTVAGLVDYAVRIAPYIAPLLRS
jgi:hypothetical protein